LVVSKLKLALAGKNEWIPEHAKLEAQLASAQRKNADLLGWLTSLESVLSGRQEELRTAISAKETENAT